MTFTDMTTQTERGASDMDLRTLSRRGFLNMGAAAGASLLLPGMPGFKGVARAAAPLAAVKEEEAVIAFGHVGPVSDEGWTWTHHQGKEAVMAAFPKAKYLEVENIPFSADATRIFKQFIAEGAQTVISSSEYADFILDLAERNPEVAILECNGHTLSDNVSWYYLEHWMPTYVVGVAAGLLSKTGKMGYVGSFPVPSVFASANAFLMGARSVNPAATLQVITINSWFDPQGASQAGTALIDNGCDFLMGIMDEAAYLQVAEKRGVWAAMWNTDIRRYGPNAYVSSIVCDWREFYVEQVKKRLAGEWTGGTGTLLPMGKGIDRDVWGEKVPAEVAAKADAVRDKILGGWNPFQGELKDASGAVRLAAGESMDSLALYGWDWPVEGVLGLSS